MLGRVEFEEVKEFSEDERAVSDRVTQYPLACSRGQVDFVPAGEAYSGISAMLCTRSNATALLVI